MSNEKFPLICVVGPTASGKTGLAAALAQRLDGEVVSADSMQIYQGMSIGTAKPAVEETFSYTHLDVYKRQAGNHAEQGEERLSAVGAGSD